MIGETDVKFKKIQMKQIKYLKNVDDLPLRMSLQCEVTLVVMLFVSQFFKMII